MRFSPVIREGESDISKLNTLILALTDAMESFYLADLKSESGGLEKTVDVIVKDALKLEDAGISDTMPAAHIRRASYWLHTSPDGICKTLIIENADRMKDEARNALLKTIEEPPSSCQIILTSARARSLLPTVLSRLRPYSFVTRNRESEIEIIRRVFRESDEGVFLLYKSRASGGGGEDAEFLEGEGSLVSRYLDGFLPVSQDALKPLASLFASCLFSVCSQKALRRGSAEAARFFSLLCESAGACARNAGVFFDGMEEDEVCAFILSKAANFKPSRLFSGFISGLYAVCGEALKKNADGDPVNALAVRFALKKRCEDAVNSVSIYNQSPAAVLYKLFFDLKRDSAGL
jgi:DNA polymerase-3 subunit gamma/tau